MNKPLVTIIIVNWNGKHLLVDCLSSLSKITYNNTEIIFVDNASTDGSVAYVKKHYPKVKIMQNKKNLGYAEGHEKALKKAKGEFVLLLSTDTIVEKNMLSELVKGMFSTKNAGAVMPKLVMYPQTDRIDSVGTFFVMSGISYHYGREKDPKNPKYNKSMEVYSAKGACLLFKKSVLQKTGLFDKDYFAYFEETDLCHRIWLAGYKVLYWPGTVVYHKGGGASNQMMTGFIQFHSYKNRMCTCIKNLSFINLLKVLPAIIFLYQCTFLVHFLIGRFTVALAVEKAIWWNFLHLGETIKKRNFIQKYVRMVPDDTFLPKVTRSVRPSYYYYMIRGLRYYKD